jgi:acetoacetate decarboxylase
VFKPEPDQRYYMPVMFPHDIPDQTNLGEGQTISHAFVTDRAILEPLVPHHFNLPEVAKVVITAVAHKSVDWLGGRPYNSVRVSVEVERTHGDQVLRGPYGLVAWQSDPWPVIAGREWGGVSKVPGEVPDHENGDGTAAFECYEYGTRLLRCEVSNLTRVDDEALAEINRNRKPVHHLGWKYNSGPGGTVDCDYVVETITHGGGPHEMWTRGVSTLVWDRPTWQQCPHSVGIVNALAELPQLEVLPATMTRSTGGILDRAALVRLD